MIKKEDLIKDNIYRFQYTDDYYYIFRFNDIRNNSMIWSFDHFSNHYKYFYSCHPGCILHERDLYKLKEATPQEKAWLLACIEANKFIPLEKVKFNIEYLKMC